MTSHYTQESVTTLHDVGRWFGTAFGHFLLGSHSITVMALGLCVKWPLDFGCQLESSTSTGLTTFKRGFDESHAKSTCGG
jgi:hypothetical protein